MVYLGECEFCGKLNLNPPNSDFFFMPSWPNNRIMR